MHILQVKNLSKVKGTDEEHTQTTVRLPKFMLLTIKATLISIGKAHLQQIAAQAEKAEATGLALLLPLHSVFV